jgi:gas vesicle protein
VTQSDTADQGSFVLGFGLGLIAGAAGYFLFATDRGENVRQELLEEWEKARESVGEAESEGKPLNVRQLAKNFLGVVESVREPEVADKNHSKSSKATKSATPKFKGV